MSMAMLAPVAAEPALIHSVATSLQQLVVGLERVLKVRKPRAGAAAELARVGSTLQQLQQWLPQGHGLQLQLVKLHKLLPALLQPQAPAATVRLLAAVYELQRSLQLVEPVDLAGYKSSAAVTALVSLTQLWHWQQSVANTKADALVQPLLSSLLQQLVAVARKSAPAATEIGKLLLQMQTLLEFGDNAEQQSAFGELAQALSLAIMQPYLFNDDERIVCWRSLWRMSQRQHEPAAEQPAPVCHDLELLQVMQLELGRYRWQWQMFLQQVDARPAAEPVFLTYPLMLLHYRLPWMLAAAQQRGFAQLCQLWYQCLMVHWQHRLPLDKDLLLLWRELMAVLDLSQWFALSPTQTSRWHLQMLLLWPSPPTQPVEQVAFHGVREGGDEDEAIPLAGIPERMSRSFGILTEQVKREWFADAGVYALHAKALTTELHLLEQGAAAIKLPVIENFCSLLLALHQKARNVMPPQQFPAELLLRGHQHLRDLLDEVSAWQQSVPDMQLMNAIKQWLLASARPLSQAATAADPTTAMLERLHDFVALLASFVEQPLHFSVELTKALPASQLSLCEAALIALLRFMVLEQINNMPLRRQALKPLAATLVLKLEAVEDGIAVEITEAGVETAPDAQTLKRLRHKLPDTVQRLYCSTQPRRGRSFRFII